MDLFSDLQSKVKNFNGEKVYSAREIMSLFGYDKWERFEGAILRAYNSTNKEQIEKNFFFISIKDTGGRPKKDIYLSILGCYFVLKYCDSRKKEVVELLGGLEKIINIKDEKTNNNSTENLTENIFFKIFNLENIFIFIFVLTLLFGSLYYLKTFNNFSFYKNNDIFVSTEDILKQKEKQDILFKEIDNLSLQKIEKQDISKNKFISDDFLSELQKYIKSSNKDLFLINNSINYRNDFTKSLTGVNLINSYFTLGNNGFYRDSCSLLSKKYCLSSSKSNLSGFSNYWKKTSSGYDILDIYKVKDIDKEIYCVKYKYNLNGDFPDVFISETFNYTLENIDGYEQISSRFCEKIEKNGKIIPCPFKLKNNYCN